MTPPKEPKKPVDPKDSGPKRATRVDTPASGVVAVHIDPESSDMVLPPPPRAGATLEELRMHVHDVHTVYQAHIDARMNRRFTRFDLLLKEMGDHKTRTDEIGKAIFRATQSIDTLLKNDREHKVSYDVIRMDISEMSKVLGALELKIASTHEETQRHIVSTRKELVMLDEERRRHTERIVALEKRVDESSSAPKLHSDRIKAIEKRLDDSIDRRLGDSTTKPKVDPIEAEAKKPMSRARMAGLAVIVVAPYVYIALKLAGIL